MQVSIYNLILRVFRLSFKAILHSLKYHNFIDHLFKDIKKNLSYGIDIFFGITTFKTGLIGDFEKNARWSKPIKIRY